MRDTHIIFVILYFLKYTPEFLQLFNYLYTCDRKKLIWIKIYFFLSYIFVSFLFLLSFLRFILLINLHNFYVYIIIYLKQILISQTKKNFILTTVFVDANKYRDSSVSIEASKFELTGITPASNARFKISSYSIQSLMGGC